jgi:hypothetical protein
MRNVLLLWCCTAFATVIAFGQEEEKKPVHGWTHSVVSGLTLTQVSYTNWAQGGENAFAWTATLEGKSVNDEEKTNWATSYKLAFGQTRLGSQGLRKTDDKIELETILTFKMGTYINPYAGATFKSQFATGYKFDDSGNKDAVSRFMDPGYVTQSAGVGYQPLPEVKTRLGAALRETFTSDFIRYADDPLTPDIEKVRVEGGLEFVTDVEWKLEDNLLFTSKLEMFSAFKTMDEVVIRLDNSLTAKVNKYVNVILNVQLINERRINPRTQVKETMAIGLSYTIL